MGLKYGLVLCAACAFIALLEPSLAVGGPVPSLEVISDGLQARAKILDSLYIKYRIRNEILGTPEDAKRYARVVAVGEEVKVYAFKGDKRYGAVFRSTDKYKDIAPSVRLSEDKKPQIAVPPKFADKAPEQALRRAPRTRGDILHVDKDYIGASDGEIIQKYFASENRMHLIDKEKMKSSGSDAGDFNPEYLWLVFHSLPDVFDPARTRAGHRLPDAFSVCRTRLRPDLENIGEAPCVVIELDNVAELKDAMLLLWCDPRLNYSVRRWEKRSSKTGQVLERYELGDFQEVAKSVWLPKSCVRDAWAPPEAPEQIRKSPLVRWKYTVLELHANDVQDDLFKVKIPPGTQVVDSTGKHAGLTYTMPADASHLDDVIQKAIVEEKGLSDAMTPSSSRQIFLTINILVLLALISIFVWRQLRKRRA